MVEAEQPKENHEFFFQGILAGHCNWVTSIVSGFSQKANEDSPVLVSGSRDKTLIIWKIFEEEQKGYYGVPYRQLTGHSHFVTDLALSQENCFVISSSWDKTLRLWDLRQGKTTRTFFGHTKEVLTVAFSPDNRQILSAGADKYVRLWNTLGDCKFISEPVDNNLKYNDQVDSLNHSDWVSKICYSPQQKSTTKALSYPPYFASVGWDGRLKIWNTSIQVKNTFKAHESNINSVSIAPNGKYVATGGKDKKLYIWDIQDLSTHAREFNTGSQINCIAFNPILQWVATATDVGIKIYDLMSIETKPIAHLIAEDVKPRDTKEGKKPVKQPNCTSLTWNCLGKKLFAGFTDGNIRVWHIVSSKQ